jgi:hypothetical protein
MKMKSEELINKLIKAVILTNNKEDIRICESAILRRLEAGEKAEGELKSLRLKNMADAVGGQCQLDDDNNLILKLQEENKKLRLLIRCESIEPPFDVSDDMTTQFAVDNAELKLEVEKLHEEIKEQATVITGLQKVVEGMKCCGNCHYFNGATMPCDIEYSTSAERVCKYWQFDNLTKDERGK